MARMHAVVPALWFSGWMAACLFALLMSASFFLLSQVVVETSEAVVQGSVWLIGSLFCACFSAPHHVPGLSHLLKAVKDFLRRTESHERVPQTVITQTIIGDGNQQTLRRDGNKQAPRRDGNKPTLRRKGNKPTPRREGNKQTARRDSNVQTAIGNGNPMINVSNSPGATIHVKVPHGRRGSGSRSKRGDGSE